MSDTTTLADILATDERFMAWLRSQHPNACVGRAGMASDCPIKEFAQSQMPEGWSVRVHGNLAGTVVAYKQRSSHLFFHERQELRRPWIGHVTTIVDVGRKHGQRVLASELLHALTTTD